MNINLGSRGPLKTLAARQVQPLSTRINRLIQSKKKHRCLHSPISTKGTSGITHFSRDPQTALEMATATETPGFVPISEWPTLHQLCDGFSRHLLPDSTKLSGKHFRLVFDDGSHIDHHFVNTDKLVWTILEGSKHNGLNGDAQYRAFEVRPSIFFVDFYKEAYEEQVSLVLDTSTGQAVVAVSGFTESNGSRRTYTKFSDAYVQGSEPPEPYKATTEMIGKHVVYRYTGDDAYEHVYLNPGTFSWHCLSGTEKGLADTEPCKTLKLSDNLYLFFWTEKIMPVESVVVIDLQHMRSTGRFFCWDPKPNKAVRTLFGSYATILAHTDAAKVLL